MHDRDDVASSGFAAIFRKAEGAGSTVDQQGLSNAAVAIRA
jgi:hypothetical protein